MKINDVKKILEADGWSVTYTPPEEGKFLVDLERSFDGFPFCLTFEADENDESVFNTDFFLTVDAFDAFAHSIEWLQDSERSGTALLVVCDALQIVKEVLFKSRTLLIESQLYNLYGSRFSYN